MEDGNWAGARDSFFWTERGIRCAQCEESSKGRASWDEEVTLFCNEMRTKLGYGAGVLGVAQAGSPSSPLHVVSGFRVTPEMGFFK